MRALLATPEPRDWINYAAARQYVDQRDTFEVTARFWAQLFAKAPGEKDRGMWKKVFDISRMGANDTDTVDIIRELSNAGWDVQQATGILFS
ncbi:ubiquitin carrier protein [Aphelenchoides avenae]|nr:ubiquitin carrier protein [Aphelenchus avenae]